MNGLRGLSNSHRLFNYIGLSHNHLFNYIGLQDCPK